MLYGAVCPKCGGSAVDLGAGQFHCQGCGRVGLEPVTLKHFLRTDGQGFAVDNQPAPGTNIRWACNAVPGCTHDTEADAVRHRKAVLR